MIKVMGTLVKSNGSLFPSMSPSFFDDFFTMDLFNWSNTNSLTNQLPAVNIKETGNTYELEVVAPGMTKEDFHVELDNNVLLISAQKESQNEEKDEDGKYTRKEFNYQSFKRSFTLPDSMVEGDKISAKYSDGILHITVPKTEEAKVKPPKQILIS